MVVQTLCSEKTLALIDKGKNPVEFVKVSDALDSLQHGVASVEKHHSTQHSSPKSPLSYSSSLRPSKLASRVKFIDGVIPRLLLKGEALPNSLLSSDNKASSESAYEISTGLNAGPKGFPHDSGKLECAWGQ